MMKAHLFPVGGDYADVFGSEFGNPLLSLGFHQLDDVVHQDFNLRDIEEGRTVGFSLIFPHHTMEDHWEAL